MRSGKLFAFVGMAVLGAAVAGLINWQTSKAQTSGPKPLIVADIDSVNGMQTSNPLANYPAGNTAYPGQEIQYDNEGISIFVVNSSHDVPILTGGADFSATGYAVECGHVGIQGWQGANYAYKLTDGNTWQKRRSPCNGLVVIGSSGQIRAQTLTIKGTSIEGKPFTLQVNVPDPSLWDDEVGGGSRRLYVDDTGATYGCYSRGYTGRTWDRGCQYSPTQALAFAPVSASPTGGAVNGNGLCQAGETPQSAPSDCPEVYDFTLSEVGDIAEIQASGTTTTSIKFSLLNKGNVNTDFPVYCDAGMGGFMGNMYYVDGPQAGQKFVNPGAYDAATSLPSANVRLDPGAIRNFEFKFDVVPSGAGQWTAKCYTYPRNNQYPNNSFTEKKQEFQDAYTVRAGACSKLAVSIPKTTYTKSETVMYTVSCGSSSSSPVANATVQVVKPDGSATTYVTVSGATALTHSYGFATSNLSAGSHTLRACMDSSCSPTSTGSVNFTVSDSGSEGGSGGLLGHWKFDGSGSNEVSGGSLAVTHGASSFKLSGGKLGGYAYIPGSADSVKIPYKSIYDLPNEFSVSFWFRQRSNQPFNQDLVYKGNGTNNYNFKIFRYLWNQYNNGAVIAGHTTVNTGYWTQTSNNNEPPHNVWHHVAYTKSTTGQAYYIDGQLISSKEFAQYPEYGGPAKTPASDIVIADTAVDTDIDDLKIFGRALRADEVQTEVAAAGGVQVSAPTAPTGLTATVSSSGDVNLRWTDNSTNENGFNVYRRRSGVMEAELEGSTGAGVTSYTDMYVPAGTYEYYITAFIMSGGQISAASPTSNTVPVTTTGSTGTGSSTQVFSAPEPTNDDSGVWAQVDVMSGQILNTTICKRSQCGVNGEYHGYVPPASYPTGSVWWPTTKRYVWQLPGQAGYSSGNFNFNTNIFTVPGGTIYNGVFSATPGTGPGTGTSTTNTWVSHTWSFLDGSVFSNIFNRTDREYADYIALVDASCRRISQSKYFWKSGAGEDRAENWRNFGIPDCSGTGTGTPPWPQPGTGTPPMEDHFSCDMTQYYIRDGKYVDDRGNAGPATETLTNTGKYYKWSTDHYHLCSSPGVWPPPTPGTSTWPIERPAPEEPRECGPGESPSYGGFGYSSGVASLSPACVMPMYRWHFKDKKWEKCDRKKPMSSTVEHSNCNSFDFELEKEWRAERFRVHGKEGEWYEPAWDATAESFRYNPEKDVLEKCDREYFNSISRMFPAPDQYLPSCRSVPDKDKEWLRLREKSNYLQWKNRFRYNPVQPGEPVPFEPVPGEPGTSTQPQVPVLPLPVIPELGEKQCKPYLLNIRSSARNDQQFWKDVKRQLKNAGESFEEKSRVEELLKESKKLIVEIERLAKKGKCSQEALVEIQQKQARLHGEIFSELSLYMSQLHESADLGRCVAAFKNRFNQLDELMKNGLDDEKKKEVQDLKEGIEAKLKELGEKRSDFEYDANFECREFEREIDLELTPLRLSFDEELNRIVTQVVEKKFEPIIVKLTEQLKEKGKKIDELLVKVAEVHKAIESVSDSATAISEKIAVSYSAMARIEEKFKEERAEIETAKDRIIPLVETAIRVMKEKKCVRGGARENMVQEFGTVASVNWLGEKASELEKRLNLFIASCEARDVASVDVEAFHKVVEQASEDNQKSSHERGLTPFEDVPTHEWYYGGMVTAAREGYLTQGRPSETVLRQDALLMTLRAAGVKNDEIEGECSVGAGVYDVSPYARCAVAAGLKRGLTIKGPMFAPSSRGEVARWISELGLAPKISAERVKEVLAGYDDVAGVDQAWRTPIAQMIEAKVMVGVITDATKKWQPKDPLTRAALAVVLEQVLRLQGTDA